jgi:hypothetical protein
MKKPEVWGKLADRFQPKPRRRMLALDGGGIRGVLTLSFLNRCTSTSTTSAEPAPVRSSPQDSPPGCRLTT